MIALGQLQLMLDERQAMLRERATQQRARRRAEHKADELLSGVFARPRGRTARGVEPTSQSAPSVRPPFRPEEPHAVLLGTTITGDANAQRTGLVEDQKAGKGRSPHDAPIGLSAATMSGGGGAAAGGAGGGAASMLTAGYAPAVIKVVSFASGANRASATAQYVERDDVQMETEAGEILATREAVAAEIKEWATSFTKFDPSQDVVSVRVSFAGVSAAPEDMAMLEAGVHAAFAGHKFIYRIEARADAQLEARVVAVMTPIARAKDAEAEAEQTAEAGGVVQPSLRRLTVREAREGRDRAGSKMFAPKSEALLRQRIERATGFRAGDVELTPTGTSHGKDGAAYRIERLVSRGKVFTQDGSRVGNIAEAAALGRDWSHDLNSKAGRDTMHLILSAKAGTDHEAFKNTARDFLHDQYSGHKFMFALHTDKEADGHIHAHAIIAMKAESGEKLTTRKADLKEWRYNFAEHARENGLKIVATNAMERASSQSYGPRDKAIVDVAEQPRPEREARDRAYAAANPHLIDNARRRIERARANPVAIPRTIPERIVANDSYARWKSLASEQPQNPIAAGNVERLESSVFAGAALAIFDNRIKLFDILRSRNMPSTSEEMRADLRLLNETANGVSEMLPEGTRQRFDASSARFLMRLAERTDAQAALERQAPQAQATLAPVVAEAQRVAQTETTRAQESAVIATRANAVERLAESGPNAPGGSPAEIDAKRAIVRDAERLAATEQREAAAAREIARQIAANPAREVSLAEAKEGLMQRVLADQAKVLAELKNNPANVRESEQDLEQD